MSEVKTKPTKQSVSAFLKTIEPKQKRDDSFAILEMFQEATGEKAVMWGTSIVGFGLFHLKSGNKVNDWPLAAFSPRKQNLTLYVLGGDQKNAALLKKLGKHKASGVCLHIKKLADVDQTVLAEIIKKSHQYFTKIYG